MWDVIGQVGSAFTLVAFLAAAGVAIVRRYLLARERELLSTPENERGITVQALNDAFLVPSLSVDPNTLSATQRYNLLLEQIRDRSRRFYVAAVVIVIIAVIIAAMSIFAISRAQASENTEPKPAQPGSATSVNGDSPKEPPKVGADPNPVGAESKVSKAMSDGSNLRAEIQDPKQAIGLIDDKQPTYGKEVVFCDTAGFSLVLAHNQRGTTPISINSIGVKIEKIDSESAKKLSQPCEIDVLSSRPFGIGERSVFVFTIQGSSATARFIESAREDGAWAVDPRNILYGARKNLSITLKPAEEPVTFSAFVESREPQLYKMWFTINYDAAGPKTLNTNAILIRG